MASQELLSTMPEIPLEAGNVIKFEAIDPNTGAAVSGVTVSLATLTAELIAGSLEETTLDNLPPVILIPPEFELTGTQVRHQ